VKYIAGLAFTRRITSVGGLFAFLACCSSPVLAANPVACKTWSGTVSDDNCGQCLGAVAGQTKICPGDPACAYAITFKDGTKISVTSKVGWAGASKDTEKNTITVQDCAGNWASLVHTTGGKTNQPGQFEVCSAGQDWPNTACVEPSGVHVICGNGSLGQNNTCSDRHGEYGDTCLSPERYMGALDTDECAAFHTYPTFQSYNVLNCLNDNIDEAFLIAIDPLENVTCSGS